MQRGRRSWWAATTLVAAVALVGAACSDDGSDGASDETTSTVAEDGSTTTEAAEDLAPPDEPGPYAVGRTVPIRVFPTEARVLDQLVNVRTIGTIPEYQEVNKLEMARGRFLTQSDNDHMENICVLGSEAADKLFPFEEPMGRTVNLRNHFFVVVGVVKERIPTGGSGGKPSLLRTSASRPAFISSV